jgi:hypothetical protein
MENCIWVYVYIFIFGDDFGGRLPSRALFLGVLEATKKPVGSSLNSY